MQQVHPSTKSSTFQETVFLLVLEIRNILEANIHVLFIWLNPSNANPTKWSNTLKHYL